MRRVSRTVPAPADLGNEVVGVSEGTVMELGLRLESVVEGVLVTGTVRARLRGECVRCLESVEQTLETDFQEMYSYSVSEGRGSRVGADEQEAEEEALAVEGDLFDLEPVLRDAVVLALPLQPVCQEGCPGLCSQCGFKLADDPEHHHETVDIRWAALQEFTASAGDGDHDRSGTDDGTGENQEK